LPFGIAAKAGIFEGSGEIMNAAPRSRKPPRTPIPPAEKQTIEKNATNTAAIH
jgi:hypothetical protein